MGGLKRKPGPVGVETEAQIEARSWFDPDVHGEPIVASPYVSFQRVGPGFDAPTRLRVDLKCANIPPDRARGSTAGQLTIFYYLYPRERGRFFAKIKGAILEAIIKIDPAAKFPKFDSPECAAIYAKFTDALARHPDRTAALRAFFNAELDAGDEPSTRDRLPRICTLHHEAGHVRHAERDYWNLLHNFETDAAKKGNRWSSKSPNARYLDLAKQMWGAWWSDYDKKVHQEIVYGQCKLFIDLYEKNRDRAFAKPLLHAGTDLDEYAIECLKQIGGQVE